MADNTDEIIYCPACGKPMRKVFMPKQGINLDICDEGCGGIYFNNREFSKFDQPHSDITPILEILKNKDFEQVDESLIRVCPVCGTDMVKNYSSSNKLVQVDECYNCGGKFLDFGELEKIRKNYNTGNNASEVLRDLYLDVGSDIIDTKKTYNQTDSRNKGLIIGVIIAIFWLVNQRNIISNTLAHGNIFDTPFIVVVLVAISIIAICSSIGAIMGRPRF